MCKNIFFVLFIKDINFDFCGDNLMISFRILINGNEISFRVEDYLLLEIGIICENFMG